MVPRSKCCISFKRKKIFRQLRTDIISIYGLVFVLMIICALLNHFRKPEEILIDLEAHERRQLHFSSLNIHNTDDTPTDETGSAMMLTTSGFNNDNAEYEVTTFSSENTPKLLSLKMTLARIKQTTINTADIGTATFVASGTYLSKKFIINRNFTKEVNETPLLDQNNKKDERIEGQEVKFALNKTKLVLFWNPPSDLKEDFENCGVSSCKMTFDKSQLVSSDALIFYGSTLSAKRIPSKTPGQVWIFLDYEPPDPDMKLRKLRNKINWTWSYRRDSDIALPYFEVSKKKSIGNKTFFGILQKKPKFAAWFVSHCNTESKRESYVREMQKQIHIDIYGKCGPLKCPFDGEQCYRMLNTDYKFYLAFENSLCEDYVTEKAFANMDQDAVVVLRGGYLKDAFFPPNSYIDTEKFSSVKQLTDYLVELSKNNREYEKYFTWKNYYAISSPGYHRGLCSICERLHDPARYQRLYDRIQRWVTRKQRRYICNIVPKDFY